MKKIYEIDSIAVYSRSGVSPWHNLWRGRRRVDPNWVNAALNPAQRNFIELRNPVFRPHPRHNPTIELFIEETTMSDRDWTIAALLFPRS